MSTSKADNIFWKMIRDQKKNNGHKEISQDLKSKTNYIKPMKKINSTFIEIIEKREKISLNVHSHSPIPKSRLKHKESQELKKYENASTYNKIIRLQHLIKEMISTKERFSINKSQMIEKINKNCYVYYKNKVNIKEIYDFCCSKRLEEHIDYILIDQPERYFADKYKNIYDFLFMLRNNNKLMLKFVELCNEDNFEQLSDFIVNFCYEDTINSSFIQEELILVIYLIFEQKFFQKLPDAIEIPDNMVSFDILRNKKNILSYIIKSLTRKADIRNFLCSILADNILKLEGNRKYLSPDIFSAKNPWGASKSPALKISRMHKISEEYSYDPKLSTDENTEGRPSLKKTTTKNIIKENFYYILNSMENNIMEEPINEEENLEDFNTLFLMENSPEYDFENISLDPFFEKNDVTLDFLNKKLDEYSHYSKLSPITLAMIDYLNSLINDIKENNYEIYSNGKMINILKILKTKEEGKKRKYTFIAMINTIKDNVETIMQIINSILEKLNDNITSIPFILKCISNIIEQLLNKKYNEKKKNCISSYQRYIIKSNFFIGNILLSSIRNRDYNGIITSDFTSKITTENLKIIYDIFDKFLSGKLFMNKKNEYFFYTLFNQFIIKLAPKIFNIIDKIEKRFKLPDILQRLIATCDDIDNTNRLNDFEYDYFFEKNEDIQYQSICFNLDNLALFSDLIKVLRNRGLYDAEKEEDKAMLTKIISYEKDFLDLYIKNKKDHKRCDFFFITKIVFSNKVMNKVNSLLKDNLLENPQNNLDKFLFFKKCLIEILGYVNIIDKESFLGYTFNPKELIHNGLDKKKLYKKLRKNDYDNIITEGEGVDNINENNITSNAQDIMFKTDFFPKIMDYLKYEHGFNLEDPKSQRYTFCTTFIQSHMDDIPKEYIENNYSKLFFELIKEISATLNNSKSNLLNQLYNKIKEGNKLNMIIASSCLQIKNMEKFKCIEYLYSKLLIPNKFKITKNQKGIVTKVEYLREKSSKKMVQIPEEEDEPKTNDDTKAKDNNKNPPSAPMEVKLEKIQDLIELIPNYREYEEFSEDIIKLEEETGLGEAMKNFFKTMKILIKKEKVVKRFTKQVVDSIAVELENYVLLNLYEKLYPTNSSKDDIRFYNKCRRLSFIKPSHLLIDKNIINENLLKTCKFYLNEIDDKYTPGDKIKSISKAFSILQNSITFSSGKKELGVDDTLKPLIYVIIKTQPHNIFTNYNYSRLFLNEALLKKEFGILLTQIFMVMKIVKDMKHTELTGVTEQQFGKDENI